MDLVIYEDTRGKKESVLVPRRFLCMSDSPQQQGMPEPWIHSGASYVTPQRKFQVYACQLLWILEAHEFAVHKA